MRTAMRREENDVQVFEVSWSRGIRSAAAVDMASPPGGKS